MVPVLSSVECTVAGLTEACSVTRGPEGAPEPAAHAAGERVERWFQEHFDALWRFAARLGVPRQHVDDVVQDVFVIASRKESTIASGHERRFLISVTIKVSANHRRRRARQLDRPGWVENEPGEAADGAELLEHKRRLELLYAALDELSEAHRAAFVLHELEGFTVPEIAELLGLPQGTAASRVGRARQSFASSAARLRTRWLKGEAP
jgi:RNA polymerase sigma-70 factor (ECF subfamily)